MSRMQMQCDLDRNETTDCPSSSHLPTFDDPSEAVPAMANRFKSLNHLQRSTLLDLTFLAGLDYLGTWVVVDSDLVSRCCEWLSIVQNRREGAIYDDVMALERVGLVSFGVDSEDEMGEGSDQDEEVVSKPSIRFSRLRVYEKFFKKVIARNPAYDTRRSLQGETMVRFDSSCAPRGITFLDIFDCERLKEVDLSCFRMLRYLRIWFCHKLHDIIGWEHLRELGWLEIFECVSYHGYPPVQRIPSLQLFRYSRYLSSCALGGGELDLSGCVRLRRLECNIDYALSSIRGLEGLRSLAVLDLGHCPALDNLPDIGHMKDLTYLNVSFTAVEEIKGVEKLSSLEELNCRSSNLKTLPDLSHLPHFHNVYLYECPATDDQSSPYLQKPYVQFGLNKYVDVSDVSDDGSNLPC